MTEIPKQLQGGNLDPPQSRELLLPDGRNLVIDQWNPIVWLPFYEWSQVVVKIEATIDGSFDLPTQQFLHLCDGRRLKLIRWEPFLRIGGPMRLRIESVLEGHRT